MAKTAIATLQAVWDCRWSRAGYRLSGVEEALQPESAWVCVREGNRRNVSDAECQACPHWELADGTTATVAMPAIAVHARRSTNEMLRLLTRIVMFAIAGIFLASGLVILDQPLAIPFTIGLWLCAAAVIALSFAPLPDDGNA